MTVILILSCLLGPATILGDDDEVTLAWTKKPDGPNLFEQGKSLFAEKKYEEAQKVLASARKLAKGRTTKFEVDKWQRAARGGVYLAELQKAVDSGNAKGAFKSADNFYKQIRGTPIQGEFDKFVAQIKSEVLYTLEDFNRPGKRYSKKYGKEFVKDPEYVREGAYALKWVTDPRQANVLKIKDVPRDLTPYRAVSFHMMFEKGSSDYDVLFTGAGKSAVESGQYAGQLTANAFVFKKKAHKGWKRITIDLTQFTQYGMVEWTSIKDFRISFPGKKKMTLYFDDITLMKH